MRKLLVLLIAVLTVLTLASCMQELVHKHAYNDYGVCVTCGDYKGIAMNKESDICYSVENVTLKTGKNYFSVSVAEYDDLEELDFYKSHEIPYEYPTNVKKVDLYDSVRLQTMSETSEAVFELSDPVLGSDGERTIYLVVECDEDETVQYICFVS